MKRRIVQALLTAMLVSVMVITPATATVAAPQDTVDQLEQQKSAAESQAASVSSQLKDLLVSYEALQQDMANQEVRISEADAELAQAQQDEQKQYADMKSRIKYMYEKGDASFIETIMSATSFSDLISKAEYVSKVHNYDRDKLEKYIETKNQVAALKDELEMQQAEMADMSVEMASQQANMESTLAELRTQVADFDAQLETAKAEAAAELARMQAEMQAAEEAMKQAKAEDNNGKTAQPKNENKEKVSQTKAEQPKAEQPKTEQPKAEQPKAEQPKAEQPKAEQPKKEQPKAEQPKEEPKKEQPKKEEKEPEKPAKKPSNASLGQQIANRGCDYIGNPYVMGGNSLTGGIDCSGFVCQIHKQFGISTPRQSSDLRYGGKAVNYSDMLPGDVICYSGHVAIYIGGNTVVHASNSAPYPKGGIKTTSPVNYKTVLAVRRYW